MKRQYKDYPHDIDYTKVRGKSISGIVSGILAIIAALLIAIIINNISMAVLK